MKVLLVCGGGFSSSILCKNMKKAAEAEGTDLDVIAVGLKDYEELADQYECVLVGPQISYMLDDMKKKVNKPMAAVPAMDYGLGNGVNVIRFAKKLIERGE